MFNYQIQNILKENPRIQEKLGKTLYNCINNDVKTIAVEVSEQNCIDYIHNLTIYRNLDGYVRKKSVIYDGLAKLFPVLKFEEIEPDYEHSIDIDYLAKVENKFVGFQIKPVTAKHSFGNYSPTERMKASFKDFEEKFGGKVFIIFSLDGEIGNKEVIDEIKSEIERLKMTSI
ncbi:MAG: hypothetical protein A2X61_07660 [Ignavibacteria bacterium GWB2_35_12]|nr:MAG: hypothetical protein A2X63_07405 [Ignavibacteria bacterium GWA2_35_8]OGU39463.1 MAG: hypothetical protein A2X61_07660 [Ignavibacteria bacterium GWB2_35_12]OGU90190.1 MAG: hypothetical protein A2220_16395 [Ignavibacteria bacterium RIFOXYA2_FULL_35_10]OGV21925.1 MAG: hypothetical protein A2475_09900 [Ignavibacteria bacterium RIFOXYC2_FULL_35_21]